jgi:predicted nucleic acid-binding protein
MVPVVVLDANVLFPMILRDTLLRVAAAGCYRVHWSERILDEMSRNLIAQHRVTSQQAERLAHQMSRAFPEAAVEGWESLEANMPNDPKDRHVAAVGVHIKADFIVTENLKDFRILPARFRAISSDAFLVDRLAATPEDVIAALRKQAAGYRNPPASIEELLGWLQGTLPCFVKAVRDVVAAES